MALAFVTLAACTPPAAQVSQVRMHQQWAAHFRRVREDCSKHVRDACQQFEKALQAQEYYVLYYSSVTVPGLSTPSFAPVAVSVHPVAIGGR